jgi:hypothetical protein
MVEDSHISQLAEDYLSASLTRSASRALTPQEEKVLRGEGEEAFLYAQLTAKKYRKYSVEPATQERIRKAIRIATERREPVKLVHPMGGYKFWKLPTTPEADWAEFFQLSYVLQYLSGVAAGYAPGVQFTYYMHTLLPQAHDNLTAQEVERYVESFHRLLEAFSPHLPGNVSLKVLRDADLYSRDEYLALLAEESRGMEQRFPALPEPLREELLRWSRENIKWGGAQDWTRLTDAEREERIRRGAIYELTGLAKMERANRFIMAEDKVLVFGKPRKGTGTLGIGSTRSSIAKYWMGIGVLEYRDGAFYDVILTPSQMEKVAGLPRVSLECGLFPHLANLRRVEVFLQHLDFTSGG